MQDSAVYISQWAALIVLFSLATVSPGPDFILTVRNAIIYSRRAAIFSALGFSLGIAIHVSYTLFGLAAIIAQSILIFNVIKYAGAAYLIYIGVQALRSRGMGQSVVKEALETERGSRKLSDLTALRMGFLTNVLNPKATLFFLAVFSQIVRPDTPMSWQIVYGVTCSFIVFGWFGFVAVVLTQAKIRGIFLCATKWIDRCCGALMIALGVKVALSTK